METNRQGADGGGDAGRPMLGGSLLRFVSDWVGGEARQPPPFRPHRDLEDPAAIEMQPLVEPASQGKSLQTQRALQEWKSIRNLDVFLEAMYAYYQGNGFYGLLLGRLCNLLMLGFLVGFSLFLAYCVDWSFVHQPATAVAHPTLRQVVSLGNIFGMSWIVMLLTAVFYVVWGWQLLRLLQDTPMLAQMRRLYVHLLEVDDDQIRATEFSDIVDRVVRLHATHPVIADRLDAHTIANRIVRRENYLVALFNKDIFNVELPSPTGASRTAVALTKTLEWNLSFSILNYVFDEQCSIRKGFLRDMKREQLSEELKRRFFVMGLLNLLLAPFILVFLIIYFVFRHGEEIYRNPRTVALRQYTTTARWKLREFNELPHYFEQRLANSHRKATKYMDQFHNSRWTPVMRLVSFVAGSLAVVLIGVTVANEDLLMHFELSPGKSVIWYLGLLGVILTISRSMVPDHGRISDPQRLMREIADYTHYMPKHWRGREHTEQVRREFSELFDYKLRIIMHELLSVMITPFILMFSLPTCTDRLVDFFREFTIHVDGMGYVCSFALFDFDRHGKQKYGGRAVDKHHQSRQGKMEKSFLSFVANNPHWRPPELGSQFLGRLHQLDLHHSSLQRRPCPSPSIREEAEEEEEGEATEGGEQRDQVERWRGEGHSSGAQPPQQSRSAAAQPLASKGITSILRDYNNL